MKILLTGATGFVGTNFVLTLHKKYEIIALVRNTSDVSKIEKFCKIYRYDESIESIEKVFKDEKIDGVVHLATAYKPQYEIFDLEYMLNANICFGTQILECIKLYKISFFINTATFSQFANSNFYNPKTLYDAMKQAFMDIMSFYVKECKDSIFTSLMLFNPFGRYENPPRILTLWAKNIKEKSSIKMGDGYQKVDFSHIDNIVKAYDILIKLCINKKVKQNAIYSTESSRYSVRELAQIFENVSGKKLDIRWGALSTNIEIIQEPISYKTSKNILKLPNYKAKISLEEGIKMLIKDSVSSNGGGALTFLENNLLSLQNSLNNTLEVA